jgi:hypothetical protein
MDLEMGNFNSVTFFSDYLQLMLYKNYFTVEYYWRVMYPIPESALRGSKGSSASAFGVLNRSKSSYRSLCDRNLNKTSRKM